MVEPGIIGSIVLQAQRRRRRPMRACEWLRSVAGVDPGALTARALDRCTWAGALFLARRSTKETALKSVRIALRDEERWRAQASRESSA